MFSSNPLARPCMIRAPLALTTVRAPGYASAAALAFLRSETTEETAAYRTPLT